MRCFLVSVVLTTLVAGCGGEASERSAPRFSPPAGPAPAVYRGLFPCEDCPGIETTLWLRSDHTFFWRQRYLGDAGEPLMTTHNLGRWEADSEGALVLRGSGPPRRLVADAPDALVLETPSRSTHRLSLDSDAGAFTDPIRIEGVAVVENGAAVLTECRTGLAAPAGGADMRRFLRQYRSLGYRGKPAFIEVEAVLEWSDDGTLRSFAVDRFVTIKPGRAC